MGRWFALSLLAAFVAALSGCVSHSQPSGTDVDPPGVSDIIAERESSVSAVSGLAFALRCATLTVPQGSLEYDAVLRFALCKPSALPDDVPLPAGQRALLAVYSMVDVRVSGTWPLHLQLLCDFEDPDPYDPGFSVYRLDPDAGTYVAEAAAETTATSAAFGIRPGYYLVTVRSDAPYSADLVGSSPRTEIAFPSAVTASIDNAFGLLAEGTGLVRLTNALAPGYRDRPYVSRDGTRVALVRDGGTGPSRLFATTPSSPQGNLAQVAASQAGWPMGDVSFLPTSVDALVPGLLDLPGAVGPGVFLVHLVGGAAPEQVYRETLVGRAPGSVACSPDGSYSALTTARYFPASTAPGDYDVALIDLSAPSDQEPVRITAGLHTGAEPALTVESLCWAPDGWIWFGATAEGESRIYRCATDGSGLGEIEALRGCRWPAVSPTGGQLVCEQAGSLLLYNVGDGSSQALGPPANGYGASLIAADTTKVSWLGR